METRGQLREQDEALCRERVRYFGEEMVRAMGAAMMQVDRLPMELAEQEVNRLCERLAECRAMAASWMNDTGEP